MLDVVQRAGFHGVELAQIPKYLCGGDFHQLQAELAKRRLTLLGLSGGSLDERREFIGEAKDPKPYLYCESVGDAERDAMERRCRIALHPHAFKEVHCLEDAARVLRGNPKLLLIPDSAHQYIVGDDILDALRDYPDRLAAIHFKDWTPLYGRVSYCYAKGFSELGRGAVPLDGLVSYLKLPEHRGLWDSAWVVYEQDYTKFTPEISLDESAGWLRERKFDLNLKLEACEPLSWPPERKVSSDWEAEARLARAVGQAVAGDYYSFYSRLAQDLRHLYQAKLVMISARGASHGSFSLLACCTENSSEIRGDQTDPVLKTDIVESVNETLDAFEARTGKSPLVGVARAAGASRCLSVPIPNRFNPHHIRFLVHIFADGEADSVKNGGLDRVDYHALAEHIGRGADVNLDDCCRVAAAQVSVEEADQRSGSGKQGETAERLYRRLHDVILKQTRAGACSIFRLDPVTSRLIAVCAPNVKWFGEAERDKYLRFYPRDDASLTSKACKTRLPQVIPDVADYQRQHDKWRPRSEEQIGDGEQILAGRALMFVPIVAPSGDPLGVVRCVKDAQGQPFSDDDIAIVDAALQAAIPQLRLFDEAKDKEENYAQLRHELKGPIGAIANIFDTLQLLVYEWEKRFETKLLPHNYIDDGLRWTELAITLIQHLRYHFHAIPPPRAPRAQKLHFLVAPIVRQLRTEFRKYHLPERVDYVQLQDLPGLFVDPTMFQEIFFNLLGNSIKYNDHQREHFVLEISGEVTAKDYQVHLRDNGKGVKSEIRDYIFEKGYRGQQSEGEDGEGYGLWIVRRLVEAHGGWVELAHACHPTVFTIHLPLRLAERAPEERQ